MLFITAGQDLHIPGTRSRGLRATAHGNIGNVRKHEEALAQLQKDLEVFVAVTNCARNSELECVLPQKSDTNTLGSLQLPSVHAKLSYKRVGSSSRGLKNSERDPCHTRNSLKC